MGQYCRYCDFCFRTKSGGYYCSQKGKAVNHEKLIRKNHCHDFVLSDAGCVMTGKLYKHRPSDEERVEMMEKGLGIGLDEEEEQDGVKKVLAEIERNSGSNEAEKGHAEGAGGKNGGQPGNHAALAAW